VTDWTPIPTELGHALWLVLRPRLGMDIGCYGSFTDVDARHYVTEVGTIDCSTPLFRCESVRDEHRFFVPKYRSPE